MSGPRRKELRMAAIKFYVVSAIGLLGVASGVVRGAPVGLREAERPGETTRVTIDLKAEGLYKPAVVPGTAKGEVPKPLALKVESQLDFLERRLKGRSGAVRRVLKAASAINGEIRPLAAAIRPAVALLVAEPRAGGVVVFSPGGPLTRSELELVEGPGDPLVLGGSCPTGRSRWAITGPSTTRRRGPSRRMTP